MCDPKIHEARIMALEQDMADVKHALFTGNGKPSLMERVATIEKGMMTQTWLLRTILGAVLTGFIGQLVVLMKVL